MYALFGDDFRVWVFDISADTTFEGISAFIFLVFGVEVACLVLSCGVLSCLVLSCRVLSRRVVSCLVFSCLVVSCRV
jgi:hypothetical protein